MVDGLDAVQLQHLVHPRLVLHKVLLLDHLGDAPAQGRLGQCRVLDPGEDVGQEPKQQRDVLSNQLRHHRLADAAVRVGFRIQRSVRWLVQNGTPQPKLCPCEGTWHVPVQQHLLLVQLLRQLRRPRIRLLPLWGREKGKGVRVSAQLIRYSSAPRRAWTGHKKGTYLEIHQEVALGVARSDQHRLESAKPKVVVRLQAIRGGAECVDMRQR